MRRPTKTLITFTSVAAFTGGALVASPAAQAAATWQARDKNCIPFTDYSGKTLGTVCAEVRKRVTSSGSITGFRARVTVRPAAGQSLKPLTYSWSSTGVIHQVCRGGCTEKTSAWTSPWSAVETSEGAYRVKTQTAAGGFVFVSASWSRWSLRAQKCVSYTAGKVCVRRHQRYYRDVSQARGQIAVHPAKGRWIKPRWVRVGDVNDGRTTKTTKDLCSPSCSRRTSAWSSSVAARVIYSTSPYKGFASANFALPGGAIKTITASHS